MRPDLGPRVTCTLDAGRSLPFEWPRGGTASKVVRMNSLVIASVIGVSSTGHDGHRGRGGRCRRGPMSRAGGAAAHADGPRVVAERRGRPQVTGAAPANGRGARAGPRLAGARRDGGAPWPGVRCTESAGPEVGEDLVDHRRLGDAGDEAHRAVAGRTRQRVDLNELLEQRCRRAGS
jgi:hypothetical protein